MEFPSGQQLYCDICDSSFKAYWANDHVQTNQHKRALKDREELDRAAKRARRDVPELKGWLACIVLHSSF